MPFKQNDATSNTRTLVQDTKKKWWHPFHISCSPSQNKITFQLPFDVCLGGCVWGFGKIFMMSLKVWIQTHADATSKLYFTTMTFHSDSHQNTVPLLRKILPSHLNGNVSQSPQLFSSIAFHLFFHFISAFFFFIGINATHFNQKT